jgi:hypothetical protein
MIKNGLVFDQGGEFSSSLPLSLLGSLTDVLSPLLPARQHHPTVRLLPPLFTINIDRHTGEMSTTIKTPPTHTPQQNVEPLLTSHVHLPTQ